MKKNSNSDPILVAFDEQITQNLENACKFAAKIVGDKAAAEDIVADKLAKFWVEREKYSAEKKLNKAYFFQSVRNESNNYLKRHLARFKDLKDNMPLIDRASLVAEFRADIHFLLKNLEPHHRRVVEMRYWQGMILREIAEELGMSITTISTWLDEAEAALKRLDSGC